MISGIFKGLAARRSVKATDQRLAVHECHDIHTLLMPAFKECEKTGDLKGLIKSGSPTPEQLNEAWARIYSDYLSLVGGGEAKGHIQQTGRLDALNAKVYRVKSYVAFLFGLLELECGCPAYNEKLKAEGYAVAYDRAKLVAGDHNDYIKSLNLILSKLKKDELQIKAWIDEMTAQASKKPDDSFGQTIIALSQHLGYRLNPYTLTVYEYCQHIIYYKKNAKA